LAPVDVCRKNHQSGGEIPLLPVLIDHIWVVTEELA
jgi:hypothetical protein